MKRLAITFSAAILAIFATTATAQDWRVMLDQRAVAELPDRALEVYREAAFQNDRVNYDETVRLLADAADKAPDHVALQFLVAARARDRAESYYSASSYTQPPDNMDYTSPDWRTAEPFYDMADAALQRLLVNPSLSGEDRERLENLLQEIEEGRGTLSERDEARRETAMPLVLKVRTTRAQRMSDTVLGEGYKLLDTRNATEKEEEEDLDFGDGALATEDTLNPFTKLPGEYIAPFLPPPPQNQQPTGRPGIVSPTDPFSQPNTAAAANPPRGFDPAMMAIDGGAGK